MLALIFFFINSHSEIYSQILLNNNSELKSVKLRMSKNKESFDTTSFQNTLKEKINNSEKFKNRISVGYGITPNLDDNWNLYIEYLRKIKNRFYVSGVLNLYVSTIVVSANGYYNLLSENSRFDLLTGGGLNVIVSGDAIVKLSPQVSAKFDFHLNKYSTIGTEIKIPLFFSNGSFNEKLFYTVNFGLKF